MFSKNSQTHFIITTCILIVVGSLNGQPLNKELSNWADQIFSTNFTKKPTSPITLDRDITLDEAYQVQSLYNKQMQQSYGKPIGYKVAYASKASQKKWNISEPTFGTFFEKQNVVNRGIVKADNFMAFHNETEIAFTISKDVKKPVGTVEELMPYIQSVHVGLDVPDNRFDKTKGKVKVADVIAMSCATHTYVLSDGVAPDHIDFKNIKLSLQHNEKIVYSGDASNVMGDPRESVLILIRHLLKQGVYLKEGDIVLSGAVTGAYVPKTKAEAKGHYIGKATGMPSVYLTVE